MRQKQIDTNIWARRNARETQLIDTLSALLAWHSSVLKSLGLIAVMWIAGANALASPYAASTDVELTEIAAGWESLSEDNRRALLTEMRARMAVKKDGSRIIAIKTQRRYGRLVRQPDGSVLRIETTERLVRFRRVPDDGTAPANRAFGVGFEARSEPGSPPAAAEALGTPVSSSESIDR